MSNIENNEGTMKENESAETVKKGTMNNSKLKQLGLLIIGIIVAFLLIAGGFYGYLYTSTASHIRNPSYEHYHIRTQIIANGEPIDFSSSEFQEDYDANSCSSDLPELPIDFHDGEDQITHIHWSGITGGELLKYYGWNLIGGKDNSLGRRFDQGMMHINHVKTKGNIFPKYSEENNYFIYVGDEDGYEQKKWHDFINMDLEEFFGTKSYLKDNKSSFNIFDLFSDQAYAHGGVDDEQIETLVGEDEKAKLSRINNLIGNVVIFVQNEEPTKVQIHERFEMLVPLHASSCGG